MSTGEERDDYSRAREPGDPRAARCACSARCCARCAGASCSPWSSSCVEHGAPGRRPGAHRARHRPRPARPHERGRLDADRPRSSAPTCSPGIVGAVLIARYTLLAARISQAVLLDLRRRVFLHAQRLSLEFHETLHLGPHHRAADERPRLDPRAARLGHQAASIRGVLYMVFIAIALVLLDPVSGLVIAALAAVPSLLLTRWFQVRSQRAVPRDARASRRALIVKFVETMTGIRAVKAFRKEKRNEKRVRRASSRTTATRTRKAIGSSASSTRAWC